MQAFLIYENYSHFTIAADLSASSVSEEQKKILVEHLLRSVLRKDLFAALIVMGYESYLRGTPIGQPTNSDRSLPVAFKQKYPPRPIHYPREQRGGYRRRGPGLSASTRRPQPRQTGRRP